MIDLAPLEQRLALFAEGIAGRYFHIKPGSEFAGRRIALAPDHSTLTADTLYLPEHLDAPDAGAYRVLTLQQLCHREFGTYRFTMATALTRLPELTDRQPPTLDIRASDFERFYHQFEHPALMSRLFWLCERLRVDARMVEQYPGIRPHLSRLNEHALAIQPPQPVTDLAGVLSALTWRLQGTPSEFLETLDVTGLLTGPLATLDELAQQPGDVYSAAAAAMTAYAALAPALAERVTELFEPLAEEFDDPSGWLQREARLEDWRDDLAAMDASLSVEHLEGDQAEAAEGDNLAEGELRPDDVELSKLASERDTLARRIDMERSAIRDALGTGPPDARSYRYDEWDYLGQRYLPRWCRLFEQRLAPDYEQDLAALQAVIGNHRRHVQRHLEHIKPLGYQRVYRLADGDELDFNAVIEARQDALAGHSPDDRVYSRRDRVQRDVCAAFLVDLSASTDDAVEPPPRRIIDVQREAMLVMSAALEQLGDRFGVYGFSGYGHDCVEVFVAKEPDERFSRSTLAAIAGMKPKRSTRMGPAIRHGVRKLVDSGNALKVLIIVSDGFPQDCDYGPERGDHEYGVQDTARALQEAAAKGVETFCVTVDRSGHDYLKRMCPQARYLVIEDIEDLPDQLSKVYEALTS
ncbi:MAG: VWA domain-containing protein [Gammaproteobacteria bacterium]|nr:VWA domain-containing protein [Gammaproteobacteria bacterium]